ncbi:hypothetical protein [Sphingobium lactosutens]|jgi:hypothetical protein|uniref:Uncharacterized protein n=1 Tax=Sphingobium lactosutens DS20 TaxID=1331060 RepID=T0HPB8_9SPHN|nr:hypothetical protein [Sphingobium lactosutens]EQB18221.1 hypothetical protein RLDS_02960 [Sphingobium lactosutens DS20]
MRLPQDGEARERPPRLHHWMLAAAILFILMLAGPLFAAFL